MFHENHPAIFDSNCSLVEVYNHSSLEIKKNKVLQLAEKNY